MALLYLTLLVSWHYYSWP